MTHLNHSNLNLLINYQEMQAENAYQEAYSRGKCHKLGFEFYDPDGTFVKFDGKGGTTTVDVEEMYQMIREHELKQEKFFVNKTAASVLGAGEEGVLNV